MLMAPVIVCGREREQKNWLKTPFVPSQVNLSPFFVVASYLTVEP